MNAEYSGLGHLTRRSNQTPVSEYGQPVAQSAIERFTHDAFGNRVFQRDTSTEVAGAQLPLSSSVQRMNVVGGAASTYGTAGRLRSSLFPGKVDSSLYDAAGNVELAFSTRLQTSPNPMLQDRATFFAADGTVRAAEHRRVSVKDGFANYDWPWTMTFEEYRYDPLGRRVVVRERRECPRYYSNANAECGLSFVRRTVWDGNTELYEIQMPDDADRENDTEWVFRDVAADDGMWVDPNVRYGRVAYAYGLSLDQPLSATRIKYVDKVANQIVQQFHATYPAFTIAPHWDWRGSADFGTLGKAAGQGFGGSKQLCVQTGRCVNVTWRKQSFAFAMSPADTAVGWFGTLITEKEDGTGTLYRRNRYVDPATGRFTQEDPIGLTGGMNLYGFAGGDPVNFSDPFGLCPDCIFDIIAIGLDIVDIAKNGFSGGRGGALAADVIGGALPFVPALAGATLRTSRIAADVARGAKSVQEFDRHAEKLVKAQDKLGDLQDALSSAKGPKAQKPIQNQIERLQKEIKGHEKEMRQKWPDGRPE